MFPISTANNFEIAFLLEIAQRSDKKSSDVDATPQGPRVGVVTYALGAYLVLMEGMLV